MRGGSGPGAGGAPEVGEGADGGAASGAVNNCDERTSLGAGKQSLKLLQSIATTQPTTQNKAKQLGWCGIIIGKKTTTPPPPHHHRVSLHLSHFQAT